MPILLKILTLLAVFVVTAFFLLKYIDNHPKIERGQKWYFNAESNMYHYTVVETRTVTEVKNGIVWYYTEKGDTDMMPAATFRAGSVIVNTGSK